MRAAPTPLNRPIRYPPPIGTDATGPGPHNAPNAGLEKGVSRCPVPAGFGGLISGRGHHTAFLRAVVLFLYEIIEILEILIAIVFDRQSFDALVLNHVSGPSLAGDAPISI